MGLYGVVDRVCSAAVAIDWVAGRLAFFFNFISENAGSMYSQATASSFGCELCPLGQFPVEKARGWKLGGHSSG